MLSEAVAERKACLLLGSCQILVPVHFTATQHSSAVVLETSASQTFLCIQITRDSCQAADMIHQAWGGA